MTTPSFNNHDASDAEKHRRANGQFGLQPRAELIDKVSLPLPPTPARYPAPTPVAPAARAPRPVAPTAPAMPGLTADEAIQWRRLDGLIEGDAFSANALTPDEADQYAGLCARVDAAIATGEDGWLPDCPVHKDREGPGEWDRWGKDFRCHVCFIAEPGHARVASINRLGLRDKHTHKWAVWGFNQHLADLDAAAEIRREVERRRAARNESVAPETV